jgi:hypothetical protein
LTVARKKAINVLNLLKPPKRRKKGPLQKLAKWNEGIQKKPFGPMGWW